MNKEIIKLSKISKKFVGANKDINVLKNINLKINKGELISLSGPSGSGKSTLLSLLSLIDIPSSGYIKIDNKKINYNDKKTNDLLRANKIGIIYQQDNLLNDFTALENIYFAGLSGGDKKELAVNKALKLLKNVNLSNRFNHYPSELSGGEKQRVSIARAIINEPQIILADEPTGSLDQKNSIEIFNLLRKQINSNRIIIFATHNRFFAKKSDCILEIVDGNIKSINA